MNFFKKRAARKALKKCQESPSPENFELFFEKILKVDLGVRERMLLAFKLEALILGEPALNIVQAVAERCPEHFEQLFKMVFEINKNAQIKLCKPDLGKNALHIVLEKFPDLVLPLIDRIKTWPDGIQADLLTHDWVHFRCAQQNALQMAVYNIEFLKPLIKRVLNFIEWQQDLIFLNRDFRNRNFLHLAVLSNVESVNLILDSLPEKMLEKVLSQIIPPRPPEQSNSYQALHLAIFYQPEAVPLLLSKIATLTKEAQQSLLFPLDSSDVPDLIEWVKMHQPQYVELIENARRDVLDASERKPAFSERQSSSEPLAHSSQDRFFPPDEHSKEYAEKIRGKGSREKSRATAAVEGDCHRDRGVGHSGLAAEEIELLMGCYSSNAGPSTGSP